MNEYIKSGLKIKQFPLFLTQSHPTFLGLILAFLIVISIFREIANIF